MAPSRHLRFLEAVNAGDLELVKKICREDEGKDGKANSADESLVKAVDSDGNRALHLAVASQNLQMTKYVVEELQANLEDEADSTGMTALHLAVQVKNVELVRYILGKGCRLGTESFNYETLELAVKDKNLDMIMCLLENGCENDVDRSQCATGMLHEACATRNMAIITYLIASCRADVNALDDDEETPLVVACYKNNVKVVRYLLNNTNVDIEAIGWHNRTPFMNVCQRGNFALMKWFWNKRRPNVECLNSNGGTPLLLFCYLGHLAEVKWLVETCGAKVDATDSMGNTALHNVVNGGPACAFMRLLEGGERSPNSPRDGSAEEAIQVLEYLLGSCPIHINATNEKGQTALHLACNDQYMDNLEMVRPLVQAGIDVNAQDQNGQTALHCAGRHGHLAIGRYLVDTAGADAGITDMNGCTALHLAADAPTTPNSGALLQLLARRLPR